MAEKTVRVIQPTVALVKENEIQRVAAYCRVSTDSEDQANSFSAQLKYYSDFIRSNEKMQLVDIYADEGITGTCVNKRDEFKRMMRDASHGKIDRIFVKSVSRFARNSLECLESIRILKLYGVSVVFENDNLDTDSMNTELILYVKSAFAQSEAMAGSKRVQTAVRMKMENGEFITTTAPYGYRLDKEKYLLVVPEEAAVVKRIFSLFLEGNGAEKICAILNSEGVVSSSGKWTVSGIKYILHNEKYIGDSMLQKTYTPQMLPLRNRPNNGEADKYYVHGSHQAIISKEVFDVVQQRTAIMNIERNKPEKVLFTKTIICEECGWSYKRKKQNGVIYWVCSRKSLAGESCGGNSIREEDIKRAFVSVYNKLRFFETVIIDVTLSQLLSLWDVISGKNNELLQIDAEISKLCEKNAMYGELRHKGILDEITYLERSSEVDYKLAELRKRRLKYLEADDEEQTIDNVRKLKEKLEKAPACIIDFDESLFSEITEKIIMGNDGTIVFRLLGGIELRHNLQGE